MTLNEATGIHQCNIDKATGKELGFRERYTRYIDYLGGLDAVKPYIPFELDYLISKYRKDRLFNNTPMSAWDNAAGFHCSGLDATPTYGGLWNLYQPAWNQYSKLCNRCLYFERSGRDSV